ncbi:hypothetical protein GE09DRAFT_1245206 [Coniochaeta sp. 2T2.1]|nr:hypothetical protein GE09DRAFT_1245206 [Coniochaeta sp. 2T2.1]
MKGLTFLSLLTPTAAAFRIPADAPNGLFKAYYDENGTEVHVRLIVEMMKADATKLFAAGLVDTETTQPTILLPRGSLASEAAKYRRQYCECGQSMDHSDCDDATDAVREQIKEAGGAALVPIDEGIYGTFNGVTSFICTPGDNEAVTPVTKEIYDAALGKSTAACGKYVPGVYVHGDMQGQKKDGRGSSVEIGYKFNEKRSDIWFCDHSRDPKEEKCRK